MSDMRFLDGELGERVRVKLVELQGDRTDTEFAVLLGCTRPHWWNVKNGKRGASYALIKRAAQHFPDLYQVVLHDLSAPATEKAS